MEYKNFNMEIKTDLEKNTFEGYASAFGNVDSYGDVIEKGAFTKTIKENKNRIKVLWQHNWMEPIGLPVAMEEDTKGLYVKAKVANTETGIKALTLMREGIVNELSIGYDVIKDEFDNKKNIRKLKEVRLWEFSPVTFAANEQATITDVKKLNELDSFIKMLDNVNREDIAEQKIREAIEALQKLLDEPEKSTHEQKEDKQEINPDDIQLILKELEKYKIKR